MFTFNNSNVNVSNIITGVGLAVWPLLLLRADEGGGVKIILETKTKDVMLLVEHRGNHSKYKEIPKLVGNPLT